MSVSYKKDKTELKVDLYSDFFVTLLSNPVNVQNMQS